MGSRLGHRWGSCSNLVGDTMPNLEQMRMDKVLKGDGRSGKITNISLTMALCFQVMVPQALVVIIATSSRNVQGRVGPALAKTTVVGPTLSIVTGCLNFFQLRVQHEVHAIHKTGLACTDDQGDDDREGEGLNAFMPSRKPNNQFGNEHANPYHNGIFDTKR